MLATQKEGSTQDDAETNIDGDTEGGTPSAAPKSITARGFPKPIAEMTPEEKARKAAEALSNYDQRFDKVEREILKVQAEQVLLKWMVGFGIALDAAILRNSEMPPAWQISGCATSMRPPVSTGQ